MTKQLLSLFFVLSTTLVSFAQTWIWYPGDYEIWLGNKMNNHRTERGAFFPPFWKQDSHYVTVEFSTELNLSADETIHIATEGLFNIKLDGKMIFGMPSELLIPAGQHRLNIKIHNQQTPPALFVSGRTIKSGPHWKVTYEDKEWIDENGKASDTSATTYMQAGSWNFNSPSTPPSQFSLAREVLQPKSTDGSLYDFGRETFGYLRLHEPKGTGDIYVYYGESPEEARDTEHCETLDHLIIENNEIVDLATNARSKITNDIYTFANSKAFRYVNILTKGNASFSSVSMDYEYMPETAVGSFRCNDPVVNQMWDVGVYTMQLTTREFFIDGIKRDRWVWSGDASQSYLMNYYLFNDNDEVKRTTWLLAGKAPISSHINTIMDYTLYWFISIYDYYLYSADVQFLHQIYPTMQRYMDYVNSRRDSDGMLQGLSGDWVFVDWTDRPMDKHGQLSFEQILFRRAVEAMAAVSHVVGNATDEARYKAQAQDLAQKIKPYFFDDSLGGFVHNRVDGQKSKDIFKFSSMFAILFDYLSDSEKKQVVEKVLLNENVLKITTPYMRFYEMEALCKLGMQSQVMSEMKDYWGGMLREGATTFWEKYIPTDHGSQHLSMYGRPYGKSLCHAWGASPIYLLGKYFVGVRPTAPGYSEYEVCPSLGGLQWFEGNVPTPYGKISVQMSAKSITISSDGGKGTLRLGSETISIPQGKTLTVQYSQNKNGIKVKKISTK